METKYTEAQELEAWLQGYSAGYNLHGEELEAWRQGYSEGYYNLHVESNPYNKKTELDLWKNWEIGFASGFEEE